MKKTVISFVWLSLMAAASCCVAGEADNNPSQSGSYTFNNMSVADALREISRDTGIIINAPFAILQETVRKDYENVSVDEIVQDLLRRQNHAIVWHYLDQKLVAIDIRVDDDQPGRSDLVVPGVRGRVAPQESSGGARSAPPAFAPGRRHGLQRPPMPPGL